MFEVTLERVLRRIGANVPVYILLAYEGREGSALAPRALLEHLHLLNDATRRAAQAFPTVRLIDPMSFIQDDDDLVDATHFRRLIYFRIYQAIRRDLASEARPSADCATRWRPFAAGAAEG